MRPWGVGVDWNDHIIDHLPKLRRERKKHKATKIYFERRKKKNTFRVCVFTFYVELLNGYKVYVSTWCIKIVKLNVCGCSKHFSQVPSIDLLLLLLLFSFVFVFFMLLKIKLFHRFFSRFFLLFVFWKCECVWDSKRIPKIKWSIIAISKIKWILL